MGTWVTFARNCEKESSECKLKNKRKRVEGMTGLLGLSKWEENPKEGCKQGLSMTKEPRA